MKQDERERLRQLVDDIRAECAALVAAWHREPDRVAFAVKILNLIDGKP